MVYSKKYDRWFSKEGLVYRYDSKQDKLVLCKQSSTKNGYKRCKGSKRKMFYIHRAVYETFVGQIPEEYEIDHINGDRVDNRLCNLRCVKHSVNMRNPITLKRIKESVNKDEFKEKQRMSQSGTRKPRSEFNDIFYKHYGFRPSDSKRLYSKLFRQWKKTGSCKWEVDNECD